MSDSFAVYVARRALSVVIVVVALSSLTFVMLHVLTPESFDDPRPVYVELLDYLNGYFLHLDWGNSVTPPFLPVRRMLAADAVPADIALLVGAMVLGTLLGIAGGLVCVRMRGTIVARLIELLATLALCAPV